MRGEGTEILQSNRERDQNLSETQGRDIEGQNLGKAQLKPQCKTESWSRRPLGDVS